MTHQTPSYVKKSSIIGGLLLLPFFLLIIAAGLDDNMRNPTIWNYHVLLIFFVALPILALFLTITALVSWLVERKQHEHENWFRALFDLRRNWPLLSVIVVGLGIIGLVFGHDSVHCATGNPIRELHNPSQTWHCIQQR